MTPPVAVLGVDIGGTNVEIASATLDGLVLERVRIATQAERGPAETIDRIIAVAQGIIDQTLARHGHTVVRHAVVVPGVVTDGRVHYSPNLPGWEQIALAETFEQRLPTESVPLFNDVRAGAIAELHRGVLRGADPAVYVNIGTGLAATFAFGGRILEGAHGAAGEIGYLKLSDRLDVRGDTLDAPMEDFVSGKALGDRISSILGRPVDARLAFAQQDPVSQQVIHQMLSVLGKALVDIAVLLDPERIAIGGGLAQADVMLPVLAAYLANAVPYPPELCAAHFTVDASLHGAITLAAMASDPTVSELQLNGELL